MARIVDGRIFKIDYTVGGAYRPSLIVEAGSVGEAEEAIKVFESRALIDRPLYIRSCVEIDPERL